MISRFARSFIAITVALLLLATVAFLHPPSRAYMDPWTGELFGEGGVEGDVRASVPVPPVPESTTWMDKEEGNGETGEGEEKNMDKGVGMGVKGGVIMSKLGNETVKAELGRATWRLLHTMTLRYPENPTQDERDALEAYMHLTARLYPCGECATEFQALLETYPPQTASRLSASLWLCAVHNKVNVRLGKSTFDCSKLDAEYDCGCGDATMTADARPTENVEEWVDMEQDVARDDVTGVRIIKGGRR